MASTEVIKCLRCPFKGTQSSFPQKRNMKFSKTCLNCLRITNAKMAEKRTKKHPQADKENTESSSDECQKGKRVAECPPTLTWDKFLSLLAENKDHAFELEAFVRTSQDLPTAVKNTHDRAFNIANGVKESTGFQFKYVPTVQYPCKTKTCAKN